MNQASKHAMGFAAQSIPKWEVGGILCCCIISLKVKQVGMKFSAKCVIAKHGSLYMSVEKMLKKS